MTGYSSEKIGGSISGVEGKITPSIESSSAVIKAATSNDNLNRR